MTEYPNFCEEKKLWKRGYKWVVGLDEAGRGPLAGPVVAAAIILNSKSSTRAKLGAGLIPHQKLRFGAGFKGQNAKLQFKIQNLKDSKKLTSKKREELYKIITKNPFIEWGLGQVSEKVIDKVNILEATKLAMKKAIKNLEKKLKKQKYHVFYDRRKRSIMDILVLDGNFKLNLPLSQKSIIKADEKVFSCTTASIIAKVTRDRIMKRCHKKYPQYGFDKHKGYPTKYHIKMLKKFGPCKIHRLTYKPVSVIIKKIIVKIRENREC